MKKTIQFLSLLLAVLMLHSQAFATGAKEKGSSNKKPKRSASVTKERGVAGIGTETGQAEKPCPRQSKVSRLTSTQKTVTSEGEAKKTNETTATTHR